MERYERDGKHAVNVGDVVRVCGNDRTGEQGWSMARLHRLEVREDRPPLAWVTHPKQAGLRYVSADRLTRMAVSA